MWAQCCWPASYEQTHVQTFMYNFISQSYREREIIVCFLYCYKKYNMKKRFFLLASLGFLILSSPLLHVLVPDLLFHLCSSFKLRIHPSFFHSARVIQRFQPPWFLHPFIIAFPVRGQSSSCRCVFYCNRLMVSKYGFCT